MSVFITVSLDSSMTRSREMAKHLIRLEVVADEESYDAVTGILTMMVSSGWQEESLPSGETRFLIYYDNVNFIHEVHQVLKSSLQDVSFNIDTVEDQNWLEAWKEFFTPVACGERFVVLPPWHEQSSGFEKRVKIIIEPKSAFGTGHHATTVLCLQILSDMLDEGKIKAGQTFLDLGVGSGVLSIGLCKSGLSGCGVDIDPIAIDNAIENCAINGISRKSCEIKIGSIEKIEGRKFNCVVANVLATPLIELAESICKSLKNNGVLILSGLLTIQADRVEEAYRKYGMTKAKRKTLGEWSALYWDCINI